MHDADKETLRFNLGVPDNERLARIETKLDGFIAAQHDHETRLRMLEDSKSRSEGVADATARAAQATARWTSILIGGVSGMLTWLGEFLYHRR